MGPPFTSFPLPPSLTISPLLNQPLSVNLPHIFSVNHFPLYFYPSPSLTISPSPSLSIYPLLSFVPHPYPVNFPPLFSVNLPPSSSPSPYLTIYPPSFFGPTLLLRQSSPPLLCQLIFPSPPLTISPFWLGQKVSRAALGPEGLLDSTTSVARSGVAPGCQCSGWAQSGSQMLRPPVLKEKGKCIVYACSDNVFFGGGRVKPPNEL